MDAMDLLHSDEGLMTDSIKMSVVGIGGRDPMIKQEARRIWGQKDWLFFFLSHNSLL